MVRAGHAGLTESRASASRGMVWSIKETSTVTRLVPSTFTATCCHYFKLCAESATAPTCNHLEQLCRRFGEEDV